MTTKYECPDCGATNTNVLGFACNHPRCPLSEARIQTSDKPRFAKTYCSQCGEEFGPGDSGFSHCQDHQETGR